MSLLDALHLCMPDTRYCRLCHYADPWLHHSVVHTLKSSWVCLSWGWPWPRSLEAARCGTQQNPTEHLEHHSMKVKVHSFAFHHCMWHKFPPLEVPKNWFCMPTSHYLGGNGKNAYKTYWRPYFHLSFMNPIFNFLLSPNDQLNILHWYPPLKTLYQV